MKRLMLLLAALILVGSVVLAADVTGKWDMTTTTPRGERTSTVEFVQDGESLKVIMPSRDGGTMEAQGKVSGDAIEWSITRETQRGEFTMTYKGTIAGDSMSGEVAFGSMGSGKWSAKKQASQ